MTWFSIRPQYERLTRFVAALAHGQHFTLVLRRQRDRGRDIRQICQIQEERIDAVCIISADNPDGGADRL